MNCINFNAYVFTTKQVIFNHLPIVKVLHEEDGDWQFLSDGDIYEESDAMIVSLYEITCFDNTLRGIIDLPRGKQAMRDNVGEPWQINDINSTEYGTES